MRILVVSREPPYPLNSGGRIRTWHTLRQMASRHDVTLVVITERGDYTGPPGDSVPWRTFAAPQQRPTGLQAKLRLLLSSEPEVVHEASSPEARALVHRLCRSTRFDLAYAHHVHTLGVAALARPLGARLVVDCHNVDSELWWQMAALRSGWRTKFRHAVEAVKIEAYERRKLPTADLVVAVSERDREVLVRRAALRRSVVIDNGVDARTIRPAQHSRPSNAPPRVVFVGTLGFPPNMDGVRFFLSRILPILRGARPDVEVLMAGGNPPDEVIDGCREAQVTLVSNPADMVSIVQSADVSVVPLRMGAGSRLKILESMAAGVPVVSTSIGCAGLEVRDGAHLLVADDPAAFTQATLRLLDDVDLRRSIATQARSLVEQRYDWDVLGGRLLTALEGLNSR